MLHFWLEVLARAISSSLAAIGKDPAELRFSVVVVALVTLLVFVQDGFEHGWRGMKTRIASLLTRDFGIVAIVCAFVFVYNMAREPYRMWGEQNGNYSAATQNAKTSDERLTECSSNLQTEKAKNELLANQVLSQQGTINSQQGTFNTTQGTMNAQQSTFNLCVATLAQANAPIQQSTTMFVVGDIVANPAAKHSIRYVLLTNKSVSPVKLLLWCDGTVKAANIRTLSGSPFSGGVYPLSSGALFVSPKMWQINLAFPDWSPEQPIVLQLDYDVNDLGSCVIKS